MEGIQSRGQRVDPANSVSRECLGHLGAILRAAIMIKGSEAKCVSFTREVGTERFRKLDRARSNAGMMNASFGSSSCSIRPCTRAQGTGFGARPKVGGKTFIRDSARFIPLCGIWNTRLFSTLTVSILNHCGGGYEAHARARELRLIYSMLKTLLLALLWSQHWLLTSYAGVTLQPSMHFIFL